MPELPMLDTVRVTLSEIEAECRKAARGAGCDWGMAEEAGAAARWLSAHRLPGPEVVAALLAAPRRCACAGGGPDGPRCPLSVGAELSDRAAEIAAGAPFIVEDVAHPLLALALAGMSGAALAVEWDEFRATSGPDGIAVENADGLARQSASRFVCSPGDTSGNWRAASPEAREVGAQAWRALQALSKETYVPATAANRLAGAGAGLRDDD